MLWYLIGIQPKEKPHSLSWEWGFLYHHKPSLCLKLKELSWILLLFHRIHLTCQGNYKKTTHCSRQNYTIKSFQFRVISSSDLISDIGCDLLKLPYKNQACQNLWSLVGLPGYLPIEKPLICLTSHNSFCHWNSNAMDFKEWGSGHAKYLIIYKKSSKNSRFLGLKHTILGAK